MLVVPELIDLAIIPMFFGRAVSLSDEFFASITHGAELYFETNLIFLI